MKQFTPPTLQEIQEYVQKKHYTVDPNVFYEYFTEGDWIDSEGKPVKCWKQKVITWNNFGSAKSKPKTQLFPISGKTCGVQKCPMPAVYKNSSGSYDTYYCADHMPEEVKVKYQ